MGANGGYATTTTGAYNGSNLGTTTGFNSNLNGTTYNGANTGFNSNLNGTTYNGANTGFNSNLNGTTYNGANPGLNGGRYTSERFTANRYSTIGYGGNGIRRSPLNNQDNTFVRVKTPESRF
jgi:hypothetical protein